MTPRHILPLLAALALLLPAGGTAARPLEDIRRLGVIEVCAHPNALPFSRRSGPVRGIQLDLAESIAGRLGVGLAVEWVVSRYQVARADCDLVMDTIADPEALASSEPPLRVSRPYFRSGVILAVPPEHAGAKDLAELPEDLRIGVLVGSIAHMRLEKAGLSVIPFGFEDEMMEAAASGEIDAAAITPISFGWFRHRHPDLRLVALDLFSGDPDLSWNLAVGMRRSDRFLRRTVDRILDELIESGELQRIYAAYGVDWREPEWKAPRRVRGRPLPEQECVRLGYQRACR